MTLNAAAFTGFAGLNHADNLITVSASVTDNASNSASPTNTSFILDTTADAGTALALSAFTAAGGVNAGAVSITLSGIDSDIVSGTITLSDGTNTATHTLTPGEIAAGAVTLDIARHQPDMRGADDRRGEAPAPELLAGIRTLQDERRCGHFASRSSSPTKATLRKLAERSAFMISMTSP